MLSADSVSKFKAGNEESIGFLVGQVMRKGGKRANPQLVNKLLREKLLRQSCEAAAVAACCKQA